VTGRIKARRNLRRPDNAAAAVVDANRRAYVAFGRTIEVRSDPNEVPGGILLLPYLRGRQADARSLMSFYGF